MLRCYDVVVAGAGPAGISAAIASARTGAKTLLIEEDAMVGGAPVDYGVQSFCGEPVCGIHLEIREELKKVDPCFSKTSAFHHYWFIHVVNELMAKEKDLDVLAYTPVISALMDKAGKTVKGVRVACGDILADVVVDCTGDGDVAASAGCEFRYGRESKEEFNEMFAIEKADKRVQMATWMYMIKRVDPAGTFIPTGEALGSRNVVDMGSGEYLVWGCAVECADATDSKELGKAQQEAWLIIQPSIKKLLENGFCVTYLAPKIGIRESRRITGEYMLTANDIFKPAVFPDAIAEARYPVDPWEPDRINPFWEQPEMTKTPLYRIPYRCLVPKKINGILVGGRCISGTHIAMSSYRVMPIASSIGQAAGVAAALSAKNKAQPRNLDAKEIQKELAKQGIHL